MYNAEQKTSFVQGFTDSVQMRAEALRVFNAFENLEESSGADLCTLDLDTVRPVFDKLAGLRDKSKHRPLYILQEYVRWCRSNGIPGVSDAFFQVTDIGVDKMKRQTVRNPRHLQSFFNAICDPESDRTFDNAVRAYYWLAYAGMQENDIVNVRASDVDILNMKVRFNGEEYPVYTEAIPAFRNCVKLKQFRSRHPNYTKEVFLDRVDGDQLLRGSRGVSQPNTMRAELSKRRRIALDAGKTELDLSYYRIWISGVFYRAYEDEQGGATVDFTKIASARHGDLDYKLDSGRRTQQSKRAELEREYRTDYERWKQTLL